MDIFGKGCASGGEIETTIKGEWRGPDLGYKGTSHIVVAAAQCVNECNKVGVLTPSIAFQDTSILQKLSDRGVHFTIC